MPLLEFVQTYYSPSFKNAVNSSQSVRRPKFKPAPAEESKEKEIKSSGAISILSLQGDYQV